MKGTVNREWIVAHDPVKTVSKNVSFKEKNLLTFEFKDVDALFKSDSLSFRSRGVVISSRISSDFTAAFWKASDILVG